MIRVALLQDDGTLRDVDVEAPVAFLKIDGVTYERHEIRNPIDDSTKGFFYATSFPHRSLLAQIHEHITDRRYGENCPLCGASIDLADDVMPWDVIKGVPHIAHTVCVVAHRAKLEATDEQEAEGEARS